MGTCLQIAIDGLARVMCMTEYLPDKTPETSNHSHNKHSTASHCTRSSGYTGRASRSSSTVDGGSGSDHSSARTRRQSAYPNSSRPSSAAHTHSRRRQHSVAYPPRRSTFSDDRIAESAFSSSCHSSRQFNVIATSSPSGIRHSRTELIADQVALLPVSNNISSRSSDVVDEMVGRSRRGTVGGLMSPGAGGRPSTTLANVCRVLSPFDELCEPSPTSLSRSSTIRGDTSSSPAPLHEGSSNQFNVETAAPAPDNPAPPTVVLHVSASTRADLVEIRTMLATYMKRLADKDAMASVTKEWRIVAKVFDRLFFFFYCATILVSLGTIFPRA